MPVEGAGNNRFVFDINNYSLTKPQDSFLQKLIKFGFGGGDSVTRQQDLANGKGLDDILFQDPAELMRKAGITPPSSGNSQTSDISQLENDYNTKNQAYETKNSELQEKEKSLDAPKQKLSEASKAVTDVKAEISQLGERPAPQKTEDGKEDDSAGKQWDKDKKALDAKLKDAEAAEQKAKDELKTAEDELKPLRDEVQKLKTEADTAKQKLDEAKNKDNNVNASQEKGQTIEQLQASGGREATLPELQQQEQELKAIISENSNGYSGIQTVQDFTGTQDFSKMSAADKQKFGINDEDARRLQSKPPQFLSGSTEEVRTKLTNMAKANGLNVNDPAVKDKIDKYIKAFDANNKLAQNLEWQNNIYKKDANARAAEPASRGNIPDGTRPMERNREEQEEQPLTLNSNDLAAIQTGGKLSDELNTQLSEIGQKAYKEAIQNGKSEADAAKEAKYAVRIAIGNRSNSEANSTSNIMKDKINFDGIELIPKETTPTQNAEQTDGNKPVSPQNSENRETRQTLQKEFSDIQTKITANTAEMKNLSGILKDSSKTEKEKQEAQKRLQELIKENERLAAQQQENLDKQQKMGTE